MYSVLSCSTVCTATTYFIEILMSDTDEGHDGEETSSGDRPISKLVRHCVGGDDNHSSSSRCARVEREYNIPYQIGSIFVVLATSAIVVFGLILWASFVNVALEGYFLTLIKQFGTGLLTHSQLMFGNQCLGELEYEAIATAIAMAGLLSSFIIEFFGYRIVERRSRQHSTNSRQRSGPHDHSLSDLGHQHGHSLSGDSKVSVGVMETGVVFHSIIIGLTLVVAGDSGFTTLFVVVIFHQMFEGLALGARIAGLSKLYTRTIYHGCHFCTHHPNWDGHLDWASSVSSTATTRQPCGQLGLWTHSVRGFLLWAALVSMRSQDWFGHGPLRRARLGKVGIGLLGLVAGMTLMGLLGK
ncbi:hypothetical protein V1517DRAFT_355340 [Lipomyces orientalis]|uniref:Uncharacterized protein n=1 Tax=Lipomyces orientalis TaxID=1233043 RepID=A0ACC3TE27_9ASCO